MCIQRVQVQGSNTALSVLGGYVYHSMSSGKGNHRIISSVNPSRPRARCTIVSSMKHLGAPPLPHPIKVVGMGSAGLDYLAQVAAYPSPDEKLRTERLETQGGGNCGNALTAAARLGLSPTIVTKIGDDAVGDGIINEFHRDGVDTSGILRAKGAPSPFTYIIVDRQGGTRTCIHTPGEALHPEEVTQPLVESVLKDSRVVYFDGRLTGAALVLARAARAAGVAVLVEAERLRPGLELLLQEADFVVTSAHFPRDWTGEKSIGDAMAVILSRLPRVQWIVTTLGKRGSVLLERSKESGGCEPVEAEKFIESLFEQASASKKGTPDGDVVCVSGTGLEISVGRGARAEGPRQLLLTPSSSTSSGNQITSDILKAAKAAAAANADSGNAEAYASARSSSSMRDDYRPQTALVTVSEAAGIPADEVLDTTGAGDAFIGSVIYCIATGLPIKHALQLGGVVAACKCTALGARPGLPTRAQLAASLLTVANEAY